MVVIASDHSGVELKEYLIKWLNQQGKEVLDCGPHTQDKVDYPEYAKKLAESMQDGDIGVLICGSGIGMSIGVNRFRHIRGALCRSEKDADISRKHNNANVCILGARWTGKVKCRKIVETFLSAEFEGGRHEVRVNMLAEL